MSQEKALLQEFVLAKNTVPVLAERLKKAEHKLDMQEKKLLDYLIDADKESTADYDGLGYAKPAKPKLYASYLKAKEEDLFAFLKEKGREDLIKEVVNAGSLSTFTKELMASDQPIPDCITYYLKTGIKLYKSK